MSQCERPGWGWGTQRRRQQALGNTAPCQVRWAPSKASLCFQPKPHQLSSWSLSAFPLPLLPLLSGLVLVGPREGRPGVEGAHPEGHTMTSDSPSLQPLPSSDTQHLTVNTRPLTDLPASCLMASNSYTWPWSFTSNKHSREDGMITSPHHTQKVCCSFPRYLHKKGQIPLSI